MSEQYPLLCDEVTEEERFSPRYRQLRMSRARAKNQVKGAAAIIARWPEQWTSLLNYWWIGIGMLAITTYLLYSCLFSYVMLETTNQTYPRPYNTKLRLGPPIKPSLPPKVFMHIFVEDKQEVDLNNYLPYIDIITKKYKNFKYQLIIVANDTNSETKNLSFQESNKLALNSLWYGSDNNKNTNSYNNLHIKYTTLSNCFYDSPLEKFWKNLPQQFLKFLVRAVSVWEKGGIAFDPITLTPQSPNSIYIDKIYRLLKKYNLKKAKVLPKPYKSVKKINKGHKHLPNNIRDVINALENDKGTEKSLQDPLDEVETKDKTTVAVRKPRSVAEIIEAKNVSKQVKLKEQQNIEAGKKTEEDQTQGKTSEGAPKFNLLPMFLKYIFRDKEIKYPDGTTSISEPIKHADNLPNKVIPIENRTELERDFWDAFTVRNHRNPTTINVKGIVENPDNQLNVADVTEKEVDDLFEITIDLKGNIIATDTACHAFIGGMFSNAIHHDHIETVSEFIIKELSIFCKGLFSSCVGIDVILF